jgi:hypothetical protein
MLKAPAAFSALLGSFFLTQAEEQPKNLVLVRSVASFRTIRWAAFNHGIAKSQIIRRTTVTSARYNVTARCDTLDSLTLSYSIEDFYRSWFASRFSALLHEPTKCNFARLHSMRES